jgi:hypothetical protein
MDINSEIQYCYSSEIIELMTLANKIMGQLFSLDEEQTIEISKAFPSIHTFIKQGISLCNLTD